MSDISNAVRHAQRALEQVTKKGREAPHTGMSDGHASVVSIPASHLRTLVEFVTAPVPDADAKPKRLPPDEIAELRKLKGQGMTSAVGEYTPAVLWEALDEIERLRDDKLTQAQRISSTDKPAP